MMSTISAISKHLLFIALTWRLYTASDIMDGSGDGISSGAVIIDQIDPGECASNVKGVIYNTTDCIFQGRIVYI